MEGFSSRNLKRLTEKEEKKCINKDTVNINLNFKNNNVDNISG